MPAGALDEGFQSLKPTEYVTQRVNFFQNLWNDEFVEGFLAIAIWARTRCRSRVACSARPSSG